jgi:hypothetical protein
MKIAGRSRYGTGVINLRTYFLPAFIAFLCVGGAAWSQTEVIEEKLGPGDTKLGRFFDTYPLDLNEGERVVVHLSSAEFDSFLLAEAPDGTEYENDDFSDGSDSRLDFLVTVAGVWNIKATSYEDDEQGAYRLKITREKIGQVQSHQGVLTEGDSQAPKGEYYDTYRIRVQENQRMLIELESQGFDSYLAVKPPIGPSLVNDDHLSEYSSRIEFIAETAGEYQIHVTSFEQSETGSYDLHIAFGARVEIQTRGGALDQGDEILEEYGYFDEYVLTLRAGQHVILEMESEEFDTYLLVEFPDGSYEENDDYDYQTTMSRIDIFAAEDGDYHFFAAAFSEGETGDYSVNLYNLGQRSVRWTTP